jgi:hypothetical protein
MLTDDTVVVISVDEKYGLATGKVMGVVVPLDG